MMLMKEVHTTALVDAEGKLELELQTDLPPGTHILTILLEERPMAPGEAEAELVRRQLGSFVQDWDAPEMSVYDAL